MINKEVVKQNFRIVWRRQESTTHGINFTQGPFLGDIIIDKVWILLAEINRNEMVETNKS